MRTLNEVIKKIEATWVCPSSDEADEYCEMMEVREDALHYLREYRDSYGNVIASMNHHLRKIHELEQNDPLTWDELKQMEGKAIWAEYEEYKAWHIIESFNYNPYYGGDRILFTDDAMFLKKDMGEKWQAYRKERTDV